MILAKNTVPTSGAGLPGISIPVGLTSTGLPIGLEIDGARNSDQQLLGLAQRVQKVLGFVPTLP
ncbi:Mandelamide hydrolase [compost metagenome]